MQPKLKITFAVLLVMACAAVTWATIAQRKPVRNPMVIKTLPAQSTQGELTIYDKEGKPTGACPLKHTDVKADISGFLVRATVTQEFENTNDHKIEAVYTFPLPQNSAVDDMTMLVGGRTVKGKIKKREEAKQIYEDARRNGNVASLLDQERPNIFTQSVTNIMPGEKIKIVISYVETLKYEDGNYEFVFPMVVGPRYIPGNAMGKQAGGWANDTDRVPDASRITPNVAKPGTRAGHDISVEVSLDAGVPLDDVLSKTHEVEIARNGSNKAVVTLKNLATLPNKDFILKYDVAGKKINDAVLTHNGANGGFFQLILQPPDRPATDQITPKELVFVLDTSGSMSGFPIEKAKEAMKHAIDGLNPRDTFNLMTFAGDTHVLFPKPVAATAENLRLAQNFLADRRGGGGTEMMKAIRAALDPTDSQEHVRIVCFMTDGYIGNENEIVSEIKRHPNARIFSFGIGSSVNRFLLDKMAQAGRGEVEYVALNDDGSKAAKRFHERVQNPLLTDIEVDWGGLKVSDVLPKQIPDLFSAKPLILTGKYNAAGRATIRLRGKQAGQTLTREIAVGFPAAQPQHDVLATLWARTKIDELTMQDPGNAERLDLRESITALGLQYRLMTQYTSFVAVEEKIITDGTTPRRVDVPVEMPEGVSYEGVFGGEKEERKQIGQSMATVKMKGGRIAYNAPSIQLGAPPPPPKPTPLPAERVIEKPLSRDEALKPATSTNVHPAILAAINGQGGNFIHNGKADVQIWLLDKTEANVQQLKQLGFEVTVDPSGSKLIIGKIAVEKLSKLRELTFVRFIAPYSR
ncbi:MAG: VWA domain-containing protein [Blastocatellia bacterium]|nr:VWA domain-containing protein [Blastocatellia bacterium]